jgi:HK97 family phage portal protein
MSRTADAVKAFSLVRANGWGTPNAVKTAGMVFSSGGFTGFAAQLGWPNTFRSLTDPWPLRNPGDANAIDLPSFWRNSVAQACLGWIQRNFPEARPAVWTGTGPDRKEVEGHPLTALLNRPNPAYTPDRMWEVTLADWWMSGRGNAYWKKERDRSGEPIKLWHIAATEIMPHRPKGGKVYMDKFIRTVNGEAEDIPPEDIVHFRFGRDPQNELLGWSPVLAAAADVNLLNEGAAYRSTILANHGLPAYAMLPKDNQIAGAITPEKREKAQMLWTEKFTGSNKNANLFLPNFAAELLRVGFSPQELDIVGMMAWNTDNVCAAFGLSSMTLNLPSGGEHRTYSNYMESNEAAWRQNILPTQTKFAAWIETQLGPDFDLKPGQHVAFDNSNVYALQEDATAKSQRATAQFASGGITRGEYRNQIGQKPAAGKEDEVFFVPKGGSLVHREDAGATAVQAQAQVKQEQQQAALAGMQESGGDAGSRALPPAAANGNGNGKKPVGVGA